MKLTTLSDAQQHLPELVREARAEAIWLTDESGNLVGMLAGIEEDDVDDMIVGTQAFREMVAHSRRSLETEGPVSLADLLAEARAESESKGR